MSVLHLFADLASAAAEGIGAQQAQQLQTPRRAVRGGKAACTPCAAMAQVDLTRKQLGFGAGKQRK